MLQYIHKTQNFQLLGEVIMRAILVDDEQLALDFLKRALKKVGDVTVIDTYTNPLLVKEAIHAMDVDVAFLDISLPEINGLELAEMLIEVKPELVIVFVTAYDEFAVRAFELNALDYLVKPVQFTRLKDTIERIKTRISVNKTVIEEEITPVKLNVFGYLTIQATSGQREVIHWRTKKAQELFLYLLHKREQLVRKSFLSELLWPDVEVERVYSLLHTTIYYVRKTLRDKHCDIEIKSTTEGYILYLNNMTLDIDLWDKQVEQLPVLNQYTIDKYKNILSLYTGSYLQEYNYWWAEAQQYHYEQMWVNIALEMAYFYYDQQMYTQAKNYFSKVCNVRPEVEDAHFYLMKIYAYEGNIFLVHKQYRFLKEYLAKDIGISPNIEISSWYESWKSKSTS